MPSEVAEALGTVLSWLTTQQTAAVNVQAVEWVSQRGSPLGSRRHIAAVRRLVAAGSPDARIIGRKYELTRTALERVAGELGRSTSTPSAEPTVADELATLRARYQSLGRAS